VEANGNPLLTLTDYDPRQLQARTATGPNCYQKGTTMNSSTQLQLPNHDLVAPGAVTAVTSTGIRVELTALASSNCRDMWIITSTTKPAIELFGYRAGMHNPNSRPGVPM